MPQAPNSKAAPSVASTAWRVIPFEEHGAFLNMALDEACAEAVAAGRVPPTIRFYGWNPSAVSIGYFQSLAQEVDEDACRARGFDIVRRRTGGGAVYHDRKGEITYSVLGPEALFPANIIDSYKLICGWIISGLGELGIPAEFKPINDIVANGKKISGNAQTRRGGILLQHGTLLYDLDVRTMFTVLKVTKEKISDKLIASVEERVTSVRKQRECTQNQAYEALLKGFTSGKKWSFGAWTPGERERAQELAKTRYATKEWNAMR